MKEKHYRFSASLHTQKAHNARKNEWKREFSLVRPIKPTFNQSINYVIPETRREDIQATKKMNAKQKSNSKRKKRGKNKWSLNRHDCTHKIIRFGHAARN